MAVFIWIFGPQAVGKMAIGKKVAKHLDFKFMHNHTSIEIALQFFNYGTIGFNTINKTIRQTIFEQIAQHEKRGFVFTYMPAFNQPEAEREYIAKINQTFAMVTNTWSIKYVELYADIETRLARNSHPDRLKYKPSKQDIEQSNERIRQLTSHYIVNSSEDYPFFIDVQENDYLKINNTNLTIDQSVSKIINYFDLS